MRRSKSIYRGHRFPAAVISCAVRWYFRFQLSLRDIEEFLFERGIVVSYETIRRGCEKFGVGFAHRLKKARCQPASTWYLDEMFVRLRGEPHWLWRTVDEHGTDLDILLQKQRDKTAAKRLFSRLVRSSSHHPVAPIKPRYCCGLRRRHGFPRPRTPRVRAPPSCVPGLSTSQRCQ